jgi:membrane associated rhomboid family serine protease
LGVDVPRDRYPVVNWLIILVTVGVFVLQVRDVVVYQRRPAPRPSGASTEPRPQSADGQPQDEPALPGITGELILDGWGLKGLFGHMWLHGGLFHLLGNMWFLWLFGNAVCAKIGNLRYLLLYVLTGVMAGAAHLLFSDGGALGASGAINGVVGMFIVLFFENEIDVVFMFWFILPYIRRFAVSSFWIILIYLLWDLFGAFVLSESSNVAYFAHLGGFAVGFGVVLTMCRVGWITMESYERSLLDWWRERSARKDNGDPVAAVDARLGLSAPATSEPSESESPERFIDAPPEKTSHQNAGDVSAPIRATCSCGQSLSVPWHYAGMTVRCTRCGQSVKIPDLPTPDARARRGNVSLTDDGRIRFTCACGRRLKVPAHFAGRHGTCPQCGSRLKIPRP